MSNNSDKIEERLIPYIEGVLSESEQQEVAEAIQADASLAREVDELKELIGELRGAFALGLSPKSEGLSTQEVVEMAAHDGSLSTMSGTSEQKARLFCNDQALEEYRLLRGLSEDMQRTTLPMADVPPMPDSLLTEIARYKPEPKVVQLAPKLTPKGTAKGGWFGFMDRLDPKPLMATAAAFVLLSLGFHVYNTPANPTMAGDQRVAFGEPAATPAISPISEVALNDGKNVVEPTGVTVFTSGDRGLLKEQAEKLLAKKVRYTVTQDRILVSENEVAQARAVLWGDEEAGNIAMAGEKSAEEQLRASRKPGDSAATAERPNFAAGAPAGSDTEVEEFEPPPITRYDYRSASKASGRRGQEGALNSYSADKKSDDSEGLGEGSALKRASNGKDEPNWSDPHYEPEQSEEKQTPADLSTGTTRTSVAPEAAELKGASKSEREKILKAMALGQSKEAPSPPPPPVPRKVQVSTDEAQPVRQEISRARVSRSPQENRTAPVANVITADSIAAGTERDGDIVEESGGAVASKGVEPGKSKAPAPKPAAALRAGSVAGARPDGGVVVESKGDVDLRLAAVRSTQASVARRYGVVLSVESVGDSISVYVRPNKELSKTELDELRRAIRSDLGLSAADTIVFR